MASSPEFAVLLGLGVGKPASVPVVALSNLIGSIVASIGLRLAARKPAEAVQVARSPTAEAGSRRNREI